MVMVGVGAHARALLRSSVLIAGGIGAAASAQDALPSREQIQILPEQQAQSRGQVDIRTQDVARPPCAFENSPLEVSLDRLRFVGPGGEALPAEILAHVSGVTPKAGSQPLSALCALRDEAANRLNAAGYIASVDIPPQEIVGGEAALQIIPARLKDVQIMGNPGPYKATITARIAQLKALGALRRQEVERILLIAGDVPGLDVALNLRPAGAAPGEVNGILSVAYTPWTVTTNAQNMGSRTIGRESTSVRADFYGLTGLSDRTFIGLSSTFDVDEQQTIQAGHFFGDDRGGTLGAQVSYAWSYPDIGSLDFQSRSLIFSVDAAMPLVRAVRENVSVGAGLELIEQRSYLGEPDNGPLITRDKLRVFYARFQGGIRAPRFGAPDGYALGGSIELRKGLGILNASEEGELALSRTDGNPEAIVLRGTFDGMASVLPGLSFATSVQGQYADDPLLSFEEYSIGNYRLGRGYDPGATSGDRAFGFRFEPRAELPLTGPVRAQAFAFYDHVKVWNLDRFTAEDGRILRSWGFGARLSLLGRAALEFMYAIPEDKALATDPATASSRFLVSLTTQFSSKVR
ncbi:ShlB/FhaC/HecB family hemolysin secretion/activation protein [Allosphingosinicella vermicomposti]|uniref:ShlB/FhaC/HecB family hemolysin secretion/activation protein n=1 Tax=Allosphingosinicella vermicomposti TaxID=614671 RepID=UPI00131A4C6D|nr:ShlB/FhaC/HecB family hemolysin secretion/activation protein [Allosphingosinicella vermicomposti]